MTKDSKKVVFAPRIEKNEGLFWGGIIAFIAIIGALLFVFVAGPSCAPTVIVEDVIVSNDNIIGPDSIEVGQNVLYSIGSSKDPNYYRFEWSDNNAWIAEINPGNADAELQAFKPGKVLITVKTIDSVAEKWITIFPAASIQIGLEESWLHPNNWYDLALSYDEESVKDLSVSVYSITETGRELPVSSGFEVFGVEEIKFSQSGNFKIIVSGKAVSDNRIVTAEKYVTSTPKVQRSYHEFSWDNENLVELTPADKLAVQIFLTENLGINPEFKEEKERSANRVESQFVFYKDNTRDDILLYQKDVSSTGEIEKQFYSEMTKSTMDARYFYVSWDDFIITANAVRPGTTYFSMDHGGDSGSSSSSSGGSSSSGSGGRGTG